MADMALVAVGNGQSERSYTKAEWKAFDSAAKRVLGKEELEQFEKMKKTRAKSQIINIWTNNGKDIRGAWSAWTARSREVYTEQRDDHKEMYQIEMDEKLGGPAGKRLRAALKKAGSYRANQLLPDDEELFRWLVPIGMLKSCIPQTCLFVFAFAFARRYLILVRPIFNG